MEEFEYGKLWKWQNGKMANVEMAKWGNFIM